MQTNNYCQNNQKLQCISSIGTANPPFMIDQQRADTLLTQYYSDILSRRSREIMHQILSHKSIKSRYLSVETLDELLTLKQEDADIRIQRFTKWAVRLSAQAINNALKPIGLTPKDITALIVNTCTGYICPGISTYLIEECDFNPSILYYDLAGTGCSGAIPNIQLAQGILSTDQKATVVSVSVEICSATFEMDNNMSLIVSNAIFGDGAAATVIRNDYQGMILKNTISYLNPLNREDVRYVHKNGRLHNQLSSHLPTIIGEEVPLVIHRLLDQNNLKLADIKHWAIHPGGDKMINTLKEHLQLSEEQLKCTRETLSAFGNMSSPTVLFILKRIIENRIEPGEWCVMVAYGAGMSVHAYLLQKI